jgi:hypothetical protein
MATTTVSRDLRSRFQFFFEHAGHVVGERAASALALARAERWLSVEAEGIERVRVDDSDPDLSWMSDEERKRVHEVEVFALVRVCPDHGADCRHAEWLASVGNVVDADRDYSRVLWAELAAEIMPEQEN